MQNDKEEIEKIENYAKSTLGGMPDVIKLLGNHNIDMAKEQFRENQVLYLGRKNLPKKVLSLTALAVSLANGQTSSAMIHFKLAKNSGSGMLEVLDSIKAAKMAMMASTMSTMTSIRPIIEKQSEKSGKKDEVRRVMENIKNESGMDSLPENLESLASVSFDLIGEHIQEKSELLSPFAVDQKYMFLMAFAVSVSIRYDECAKTYVTQFFMNGGKVAEAEDAIAVARFITGNKVMTSAVEILKW